MMKKTLKLAVAASVFTAPAFAAGIPSQVSTTLQNMENPLYMPAQNTFYSKLSNSVRLKVVDDTQAQIDKGHNGAVEFPIIRIQENMGYGITDWWSVHFGAQYTHDEDADRTGLSMGRLGTTFRVLNTDDGWIWDLYGDLHLGGIGKMRGQYNVELDTSTGKLGGVFDYDNYSNGMWGYHVGTKFGRVWNDRLTTSAFVEVLRTIGNHNNAIRVVGKDVPTKSFLLSKTAPDVISVELKSITDVNTGIDAFYQINDRWSLGGWFHYEHHSDEGVNSIVSDLGGMDFARSTLEQQLSNMNDGFDDYIFGLSIANQVTEHAQIVLFGEYVYDVAHERSQNGTDFKGEMGVRVNVKF